MSIANSATSTGFKNTFQSLLDVQTTPYEADNILRVNAQGTGITQTNTSSLLPPIVGSGLVSDIATFTGGTNPILTDSGMSIVSSLNTLEIKPQSAANNLKLSSEGRVIVQANNNINLVSATANINNTSESFSVIAYNTIQLGANNQLIIQIGANQVIVTPTAVEINSGAGIGLKISNNNAADVWNFSGSATGGSYTMPTTGGLNGSVLTNDGFGGLSWVGGA